MTDTMSQSDENKKQGVFLTQEDIDLALRPVPEPDDVAGGGDEEILVLDESDVVVPGAGIDEDSEDLEYFGLLSKEDIEALLHGDLVGSNQQEDQDEIDSLLDAGGGGTAPDDAVAREKTNKKDPTQDEVEQLLQSAARDAEEEVDFGAAPVPEAEETASGAGDTVSQDDIERLLADAADDVEGEAEVVPEVDTAAGEEGAVSQDDIDQLLMSAVDDMEDESEQPREIVSEEPEEGAAISQGDIDRLLKGAEADMGEEPETAPAADSVEPEEAPDASAEPGSLISQADLDQLMGEAVEEAATEAPSTPDADDASDHITQDDINKLLKESIEEEEEEAEAPEDAEADLDEPVDEEVQEPVILAEDEPPAEPETVAPKKSSARKKLKIKRKVSVKSWVLTGVAAGIVLLVSASLVMMKTTDPVETAPQPRVLAFNVSSSGKAASEASPVSGKSLQLSGFVVLAPPNSSAVTYLVADVFLALSDAEIVAVIKENEAFVRDIIYGTINQELMTRDISDIDEVSLELAIRKALDRIIPREAIERIDFERFSMA